MRFAMVCDEMRIPATNVSLDKTYYFCTWTPQKTLSTRNRADPIRFRSLGSVFGSFWVRFGSVFFKNLLPACMGSTIFQNDRKHFRSKKPTFLTPPKMASKRAFFGIVFAPVGPLAVPIAFFSHLEPFRIPQTAHDLCIFSLRSPVNKNDRMHHTVFFVNFVAIDATFSFLVRFRSVLGPFWVRVFQNVASCLHGEHNFAKRLQALSTKQIRLIALRMATK